jgi:N,N'-diacetyllegionaminate synthase
MNRKSTIIIAEAGVNHNGKISLAKKLVDVASKSGADFIKFQSFITSHLVTSNLKKANYQKKSIKDNKSQFKMLQKLELSSSNLIDLSNYCSKKKIGFIVSAFDIDSLKFVLKLKTKFIKIPSGEITDFPYLKIIGKQNRKIILSTGMSSLSEIKDALKVLYQSGQSRKKITLLHCNSEYPTNYKDVNLLAMQTIRKKFNVDVGYSDHTNGFEVAIGAVSLGAKIIEKHITLNKKLIGPDHIASLGPQEFFNFVKSIKNIEKALGTTIKKPSRSELKNIPYVRKVIVASRNISKGKIIKEYDLLLKRAGKGIPASKIYKVIGSKANKNYKKDQVINLKTL